ncbi:MAG TPA: cytochrome c maturation protein CcmE [Bacteroidales bacterium]
MKTYHIVLIVIIVMAIGVIISTFTDTSTYTNFKEAGRYPGKEFHIIGKLIKDKPIVYDSKVNANQFSFFMRDDKGIEKQVIYRGSKPQDFEKSEQVVVMGTMEGETFSAKSLLLKCPSKYNNDKKPESFTEKEYKKG